MDNKQDIYLDKYGQLLVKISVSPIYGDTHVFAFYEPGVDYFDPMKEVSMTWYRLDEVHLLEDHELVMYKLIGKIK